MPKTQIIRAGNTAIPPITSLLNFLREEAHIDCEYIIAESCADDFKMKPQDDFLTLDLDIIVLKLYSTEQNGSTNLTNIRNILRGILGLNYFIIPINSDYDDLKIIARTDVSRSRNYIKIKGANAPRELSNLVGLEHTTIALPVITEEETSRIYTL